MTKRLLFIALTISIATGLFAQEAKFDRSVKFKENFEAAIPHPEQDRIVSQKLAELEERTGKKPNILLLVADDVGYGDFGAYGGGAQIGAATPNIDQIATEGLKLTAAYSQHTCTPTRATILTGRLPVRSGLTRPILAGDNITKNPWEGELSSAELLSEAGYHTMLVGKWHLGEPTGMRPHDVGFDEFYGYYPAQKEISQGYDPRRYPDLIYNEDRYAAFEGIKPDDHLIHGFKGGETNKLDQVTSTEDMGRADQVLVDFTISKIKELAKGDKPFFIDHCFMKAHADNFDNPDYPGLSASKYPYKNSIAEIDKHVGDIYKALEEAGILENTLILITSDNGPQMDSWPDSGYTPFRGAKGTTWEGGVRIPAIFYWKGMIAPRESAELFDLTDVFGLTLRLAGVDQNSLPSDKYYDYVDQTSFILHDEGESNRETVYFWWGTELMACRMKEYKIHVKVIQEQSTHMYIDKSLIQDVGLAPWLFNLYIDPKEEIPVGHRRNAWLATMGAKLKQHAATFRKYPPKDVGLGN